MAKLIWMSVIATLLSLPQMVFAQTSADPQPSWELCRERFCNEGFGVRFVTAVIRRSKTSYTGTGDQGYISPTEARVALKSKKITQLQGVALDKIPNSDLFMHMDDSAIDELIKNKRIKLYNDSGEAVAAETPQMSYADRCQARGGRASELRSRCDCRVSCRGSFSNHVMIDPFREDCVDDASPPQKCTPPPESEGSKPSGSAAKHGAQ